MLAPPPPILLHSTSLDHEDELEDTGVRLGKDKRSNSYCVSDGLVVGYHQQQQQRRPSRAFLIRQRSGEEATLVTLVAKSVHPVTIVKKSSLSGSLSNCASNNDLQVSPEALEAKRMEKLVRNLRRQASKCDSTEDDPIAPTTPRLGEWKRELQVRNNQLRRKSAVAEFLDTPENLQFRRAGSEMPRIFRAHSQQGAERLELPNQGRITRALSHQGEVPILLPPLKRTSHDNSTPGSSRRSSLYPTTSRRCSEAVAAYAASGDLEAVAEMLKADKDITDTEDFEDFVVPPEKERKRLVLVISCIGLTMTFLAAIMVGITLGLSHVLDQTVTHQRQTNASLVAHLPSNPSSSVFDHPIVGFDRVKIIKNADSSTSNDNNQLTNAETNLKDDTNKKTTTTNSSKAPHAQQ